MDDCIFCKIARHELDARVVYEDDDVVAFDDLTPQGPVHTLIIPKQHFTGMGDGVPDSTLAAIFRTVPVVAEAKGVAETGYRVIVNNGPHASQSVDHLHVHVIGGRQMHHGMVSFS